MNESECKAFEKYKKLGYDVIRSGIPDLLLLKEGKIEFLEVKTGTNQLSDNQKKTISLLKKHGIPVKIEIVKDWRFDDLYSFPLNLRRHGRPKQIPSFPSWIFSDCLGVGFSG